MCMGFVVYRVNPARARILAIPALLLCVGAIVSQTQARIGNGTGDRINDAIQLMDWQAGRFSLVSAGIEISDMDGYAFGTTLLEGPAKLLNAPSYLAGGQGVVAEPANITGVVGTHLRGPSVNGIVPGTICEFYYNFGWPGVFFGYICIGLVANICIRGLQTSENLGALLTASYGFALVCSWLIPMSATLPLYLLGTYGLPCVITCPLYAYLLKGRQIVAARNYPRVRGLYGQQPS